MERLKKHSCPGAIVSSVIEFGSKTDDSDKDVDNKENNDYNKLLLDNSKPTPPSLEWLQKTLRRSRSEYHQNNRSRTNFMSVQVKIQYEYEYVQFHKL